MDAAEKQILFIRTQPIIEMHYSYLVFRFLRSER